MTHNRFTIGLMVVLGWFLVSADSAADTIRIAVASNFAKTIKPIVTQFEKDTVHQVLVALGSTGKHYAQIQHGARFDIFLAADVRRPLLLEQSNKAVPGSRFTYAIGKLVLWSRHPGLIEKDSAVLETNGFDRLAIANPKLAPYGKAARQVLQSLGIWEKLKPRTVRGENIGQTFQFVMTGNAQLGFVALSQVIALNSNESRDYWVVDKTLYDPIDQQAVLLVDTPAARAFIDYLESAQARAMIVQSGYDVP
ncbi:MAG: molybdate ABC transporter substrate-binding protein [Gammaproteobacteria bacterium]|jgi:molybdate transport system substrate-binding protein